MITKSLAYQAHASLSMQKDFVPGFIIGGQNCYNPHSRIILMLDTVLSFLRAPVLSKLVNADHFGTLGEFGSDVQASK